MTLHFKIRRGAHSSKRESSPRGSQSLCYIFSQHPCSGHSRVQQHLPRSPDHFHHRVGLASKILESGFNVARASKACFASAVSVIQSRAPEDHTTKVTRLLIVLTSVPHLLRFRIAKPLASGTVRQDHPTWCEGDAFGICIANCQVHRECNHDIQFGQEPTDSSSHMRMNWRSRRRTMSIRFEPEREW